MAHGPISDLNNKSTLLDSSQQQCDEQWPKQRTQSIRIVMYAKRLECKAICMWLRTDHPNNDRTQGVYNLSQSLRKNTFTKRLTTQLQKGIVPQQPYEIRKLGRGDGWSTSSMGINECQHQTVTATTQMLYHKGLSKH